MAAAPTDRAPDGAEHDALLASLQDLGSRIQAARERPPAGGGPGRRWVAAVVAVLALLGLVVGVVALQGDDAADVSAPGASTETTAAPSTTAAPPATAAPTTAAPTVTEPEPAGDEPAATPAPSGTDDAREVTVQPGDSFWTIAEDAVAQRLGHPPTDAEVAAVWVRVLDANADRLVEPGNFDLILPGQAVLLPVGAAP